MYSISFFFLGLWDVYEGYVRGRTGWRSITSGGENDIEERGRSSSSLALASIIQRFCFCFYFGFEVLGFSYLSRDYSPNSFSVRSGFRLDYPIFFKEYLFFPHSFVIPLSVQGPYHHQGTP